MPSPEGSRPDTEAFAGRHFLYVSDVKDWNDAKQEATSVMGLVENFEELRIDRGVRVQFMQILEDEVTTPDGRKGIVDDVADLNPVSLVFQYNEISEPYVELVAGIKHRLPHMEVTIFTKSLDVAAPTLLQRLDATGAVVRPLKSA